MKGKRETLRFISEHLAQKLSRRHLSVFLLLLGLLCFVIGYAVRPVEHESVTLLYDQTYELPEGGRVSLEGESAQLSQRTLTGVQRGTAQARVEYLTEVKAFDLQVYPPAPQGEAEREVNVDTTCRLAKYPDNYPVEWSSSDESVATVKKGVVTALQPGTAKITQTLNDFVTYTYTVTVPRPVLDTKRYTVYTGETIPLEVGNYDEEIQWTVQGDAVQVDDKGVVTAQKPGEAVLTAVLGGEELKVKFTVQESPLVDTLVTLQTNETYQLQVSNALGKVKYSSADESVATVDKHGLITPVAPGVTTVAVEVREKKLWTQVTVKYTAEELFRISNYGDYQPEGTSIAALAMLGLCDYYNDVMMADKANWYDTNLTSFSPKDTFEEERKADKRGANCNSLLNWSWADMDIKSGHATKLYGDRQGELHGYNSSNRSLRSLVNSCCEFREMHGATLSKMVKNGSAKPGDMFFMKLHTYIYRGEGTVFASAGDAKCRRKGGDLIFLNWINGHSSYDWKRKTSYRLRFRENYIPPYYLNKAGELVENPMYTVQKGGTVSDEAYAAAVAASGVKKEEVLKNLKAGKEETEEEEQEREGLLDAAVATQSALAAEGGVEGAGETDAEPNTAGGKPYGARPAQPYRRIKTDRSALGTAGGKPYGPKPAADASQTQEEGSGGKAEENQSEDKAKVQKTKVSAS